MVKRLNDSQKEENSSASLENIAIKVNDQDKVTALFFSLFEEKKYDECIKFYKENLSSLNRDFYEVTYTYIYCLIEKNKFSEARSRLKEELSMPYIPKDYEKKFVELVVAINSKEDKKSSKDELNLLSREEIIDCLINENRDKLVPSAILQLSKLNIREYLPYIQTFFLSNNKNLYKLMLIDALNSQMVNYDFEYFNQIRKVTVNPLNYVDILKTEQFKNIDKLLKKNLELKYPSNYLLSKDLTFLYLCYIWPNIEIDVNEVACAIDIYVKNLITDDLAVKNLADEYLCDTFNLEYIVSILSKACVI